MRRSEYESIKERVQSVGQEILSYKVCTVKGIEMHNLYDMQTESLVFEK